MGLSIAHCCSWYPVAVMVTGTSGGLLQLEAAGRLTWLLYQVDCLVPCLKRQFRPLWQADALLIFM